MPITTLEIGQKISNAELAATFDCALAGTMRKSKEGDALVLISDYTKKSCHDKWIGEVLHFTGAGKTGDQDIHKGQNATLCDSRRYKIDIYLLELLTPGEYTYCGKVELDSTPYAEMQPGEDGRERMAWVFPIRPVHDEYFKRPDLFVFKDMDDYKENGSNAEKEYEKILGTLKPVRPASSRSTSTPAKPAFVYQAPVKEVIEIPADIVGKKIKHKRFGTGVVTAVNGQSIEVDFETGGTKKCGYEVCVRNKLIEILGEE